MKSFLVEVVKESRAIVEDVRAESSAEAFEKVKAMIDAGEINYAVVDSVSTEIISMKDVK